MYKLHMMQPVFNEVVSDVVEVVEDKKEVGRSNFV